MKISNWGNYPKIEGEIREWDSEWREAWGTKGFIVRGLGRSYGDASLNKRMLSSLKNKGIINLSPQGILHVRCGTSLAEILKYIVPRGFFLPVTPGTKFVTIGGAIAADVHGKNHHKEGTIFNSIQELKIWNLGSEIICGPNKESELFNWTCGGMGLTGVILEAKLQLKPIKTDLIRQKIIKSGSLKELIQNFEKNESWTYSVAWLDTLSRGKKFGRGILFLGEHAREEELKKGKKKLREFEQKKKINLPFFLPEFALNRFSIKLLNHIYYELIKEKPLVDLDTFFYPLDRIQNWNRAYGRAGFVQYQFVIPFEKGYEGLKYVLENLQQKGLYSFLTVLKLFGRGRGFMSFPIHGYTLALDFPATSNNLEQLDQMDELIHKLGGRVYLAKDARLNRRFLETGYDKLADFKKFIQSFSFKSSLSERLGIK